MFEQQRSIPLSPGYEQITNIQKHNSSNVAVVVGVSVCIVFFIIIIAFILYFIYYECIMCGVDNDEDYDNVRTRLKKIKCADKQHRRDTFGESNHELIELKDLNNDSIKYIDENAASTATKYDEDNYNSDDDYVYSKRKLLTLKNGIKTGMNTSSMQMCAENNPPMTSNMPVSLQNKINFHYPELNSKISNARRLDKIYRKQYAGNKNDCNVDDGDDNVMNPKENISYSDSYNKTKQMDYSKNDDNKERNKLEQSFGSPSLSTEIIEIQNDYDSNEQMGRMSSLPTWTQIPKNTFYDQNIPSPGLNITDQEFANIQTIQELSDNVPYEYANNPLNVMAQHELSKLKKNAINVNQNMQNETNSMILRGSIQQNNENNSNVNQGLSRNVSCIASSQIPCEQSIAWQPTYIGCQSTIIEPNEPYVLYKKSPEIWFRNLDDVLRERSMENAKEWDYYKFFDGRQKLAQFLNAGIVNRRDKYMRPVSTLDETYCFGNPNNYQ